MYRGVHMVLEWIPEWLAVWLVPGFTQEQIWGLIFVLGACYIATISDLKYMSAQKEFVEGWALILVIILIIDVYTIVSHGIGDYALTLPIIVKWVILLILSGLSHMRAGVIFSLATGDVVAIMMTCALLSPILILIYFVFLKVFDLIERPILRRVGSGDAYPFMPVIFAAIGVMILLALWLSGYFG
jgi:hypothetical protein